MGNSSFEDNLDVQRWLREIKEELDKHGPGYSIEITGVEGKNATATLRNKHGAYSLVSGDVNQHGTKCSTRGPYDSIEKLPDGNYLGKRLYYFDTLDPTGEVLEFEGPDPFAGRHFFDSRYWRRWKNSQGRFIEVSDTNG